MLIKRIGLCVYASTGENRQRDRLLAPVSQNINELEDPSTPQVPVVIILMFLFREH